MPLNLYPDYARS